MLAKAAITVMIVSVTLAQPQLTPTCTTSPQTFQVAASATSSTTAWTSMGYYYFSNVFGLYCFAYDFVPDVTPVPEECQGVYNASSILFRIYQNDLFHSATPAFSMNLDRAFGGSLSYAVYEVPSIVSTAEILVGARNVPGCTGGKLRIAADVYTFWDGAPITNGYLPMLTQFAPALLSKGQIATFTFFRGAPIVTNGALVPDAFAVIQDTEGKGTCQGLTSADMPRFETATISGTASKATEVWSHTFVNTGLYELCAWSPTLGGFTDIGGIFVFGNDPAYFTSPDLRPGGRSTVNSFITVTFTGTSLDLRPDIGDRAKLVSALPGGSCVMSAPAGGVPENTDLGVDDSFGPTVTQSVWRFQVKTPGSYKVCYKRAGRGWETVPLFDELPFQARQFLNGSKLAPPATLPPTTMTTTTTPPDSTTTTTSTTVTTSTTTPSTSTTTTTTESPTTTSTTTSTTTTTTTSETSTTGRPSTSASSTDPTHFESTNTSSQESSAATTSTGSPTVSATPTGTTETTSTTVAATTTSVTSTASVTPPTTTTATTRLPSSQQTPSTSTLPASTTQLIATHPTALPPVSSTSSSTTMQTTSPTNGETTSEPTLPTAVIGVPPTRRPRPPLPTAPPGFAEDTTASTTVFVTVTAPLNRTSLQASLSVMSFAPLDNVFLLQSEPSEEGQEIVVVSIDCPKDECDEIERTRYLLWVLNTTSPQQLQQSGIISASVSSGGITILDYNNTSGAAAADAPPPIASQPAVLSSIVLAAVVIVLSVVVAVLIYRRYRRNRHNRHQTFVVESAAARPDLFEMAATRPAPGVEEDVTAAAATMPSPHRNLLSEIDIVVEVVPDKPLHD